MAAIEATGARAEMSAAQLEFRKCRGVEEFEQCVHLQKEVWNFADLDLVPLRMFVVADKIGGQVMGCFDGNEMIGFALSIPGSRSSHPYLHSHMLAVLDKYRNQGVGRKLKLLQRQDAMSRNFELIEWTFDPLEIKNAFLNIEKLGAIARRYTLNQYGMSSSPLQGGLPTDRLVAEWWLRSNRVKNILAGKRPKFRTECEIEVPAQVYEWKASPAHRGQAKQVQSRNRDQFLQGFDSGLSVLGYDRDDKGNGKFLLGKWDESWSYATEAH